MVHVQHGGWKHVSQEKTSLDQTSRWLDILESAPVGGEPDRLRDFRRGRRFGSLEAVWRPAVAVVGGT